MTIPADVLAYCKSLDEITLMEKLEITSEDLVERFEDKIIVLLTELEEELEDTGENDREWWEYDDE